MLLGISAVGQFALGMFGDEVILYNPISKIGSSGSYNSNPILVSTISSPVSGETILWDDNSTILWDDNTEITFG